jgi:hypothetical protein
MNSAQLWQSGKRKELRNSAQQWQLQAQVKGSNLGIALSNGDFRLK